MEQVTEQPAVQSNTSVITSNSLCMSEASSLIQQYFVNDVKNIKPKTLHSYYTCSGTCSHISESETNKMKANSKSKKGIFQHGWLTDKSITFDQNTGVWWLLYIKGKGMHCQLFWVHNAHHKFNKAKIFNLELSKNFKKSADSGHANSQGHIKWHIDSHPLCDNMMKPKK